MSQGPLSSTRGQGFVPSFLSPFGCRFFAVGILVLFLRAPKKGPGAPVDSWSGT